jgi:hypothetical protein
VLKGGGVTFLNRGKTNIIKVMAREKRKVSAIKTARIKDFYSFKFHFYDSFFLMTYGIPLFNFISTYSGPPNRALIKHFLRFFSFVSQTCRNPYHCLTQVNNMQQG